MEGRMNKSDPNPNPNYEQDGMRELIYAPTHTTDAQGQSEIFDWQNSKRLAEGKALVYQVPLRGLLACDGNGRSSGAKTSKRTEKKNHQRATFRIVVWESYSVVK
jgi:hypothetical protein